MDSKTVLMALIIAGLLNGLATGAILLIGNRRRQANIALGGLMILAAATGILILLYGQIPPADAGLVLVVELALTLIAGPLLLIGVSRLLRLQIARWQVLFAIGAEVTLVATSSLTFWSDPVIPAVLGQMGFTAWGLWLYKRYATASDQRTRQFGQERIALALLLAMVALHGVQLVKMAMPSSEAMAWAVPVVLAVIMALTATALITLAARRIDFGGAPKQPDTSPKRAVIDAFIAERLNDPDLDGARLAAEAGLSLPELRAFYATEGGVAAALRGMRIDKAAEQLSDPAEAHVSIDAISLGCGFRSRSAFYEAFRKVYGCNPGDYRKRAQSILS